MKTHREKLREDRGRERGASMSQGTLKGTGNPQTLEEARREPPQ